MTNLERYQRMSAEEFAEFFHETFCHNTPTCRATRCEECKIKHLNEEYKEEDRT